jgi:tRNA(Arg) A34 adenosine deaminase TadA
MVDPQQLMQAAIQKARDGIGAGQSPFGCAIATGGRVLSAEHNTVVSDTDTSAHAEINAVRAACRELASIHLKGAIVATTCEPCPMCMAALHWAQVKRVYYGATIEDAQSAGFNELTIPAAELLRLGGSTVELIPDLLRNECRSLFALWEQRPDRIAY